MILKNAEVRTTMLAKVPFYLYILFSKFSWFFSSHRSVYQLYQSMKGKKGIKFMVMEGDLTLSGEHTMSYTDDVL